MLGLDIGVALGGAIFTEAIFNLPGLGRLALNSVLNLDLPTMQGVVVFATLAIILLNLIVDLVYAYDRPSDPARVTAPDANTATAHLGRTGAPPRRARPAHLLQDRRRDREGRRRRLVRDPAGGDARRGGRVGLREERDDDVDPQAQPEARADRGRGPGRRPARRWRRSSRASKKHTSASTGQALFRGENLLEASQRRLRALRGSEVSMIFQDPMTSLNPVLSIGNQLIEAVVLHRDVTTREARELAIEGLAGGRDPAARAADRRLPAPVLGRHAPARDDRDGPDQRARRS